MMRGGLVADAVAIISSVDPVLGEVGPMSVPASHGGLAAVASATSLGSS